MKPSDKEGQILNNSISNKVNCSSIIPRNDLSVTQPLVDEKGNINRQEKHSNKECKHENQASNEVTNLVKKGISIELTDRVENNIGKELTEICGDKENKYANDVLINNDNKPPQSGLPPSELAQSDKIEYNNELLTNRELKVTQVLFTLRWRLMTQILLALPVIGLFICLLTSLIYHADHINNTICEVYNFLPSISAVTGVSPQRYLWRVCVALHISPRLLVAWVAKEYYSSLANRVTAIQRPAFQGMVMIAFFLNLTELATLCGVTYISNKENYPVHEKLFMLFMIASLIYMVVVVHLLKTVESTLPPFLLRSLTHKKWLLGTKISATIGLLFFFYRHRVHCQPKAFSWFSLCEYIIATCNMLYHVSVALDFSEEHLIVGHIVDHEALFVDHIATPTAPSSPVTDSVVSKSSLSTSLSETSQNNFNEYLRSRDLTSDGDLLTDSKAANNIKENDVSGNNLKKASGSVDYMNSKDSLEERCFNKSLAAIKNTPPKGLDLVTSSSYYSKFSGSSNSSTSSESPCFTDSSSSENASNSSGNASASSDSYSPDYVTSTSSGFTSFYDSGSVKQVLSTIHENSESFSGLNALLQSSESITTDDGICSAATASQHQFSTSELQRVEEDPKEDTEVVQTYSSSTTQSLLDRHEFVIKERVVKSLGGEEDTSQDQNSKDCCSDKDSKPKTSNDGYSLQSLNFQNISSVDKTHLE